MKRSIVVTNNIKGYHKYENAPDDVSFLRNDHRHTFNIKTTIEVFHNDRELEFFQLQDFIEGLAIKNFTGGAIGRNYIKGIYIQSCECLGEFIVRQLKEKYPNRSLKVEVWEDNENGCIIEED